MQQAANIPMIVHALRMCAQNGQIPAELHVNSQMRDLMAAGIAALDPKMAGIRKPVLKKFMGVKVVVNDAIPDNGIVVRPIHLLDRDDWLQAMQQEFQSRQEKPEETVVKTPATPERPSPAEMEELDITADDFIAAKPTSTTDVLLEAAVDCDNVRGVIVLEVRGMQNLYLRSNLPRWEVYGVLSASLTRVAQGE